MTKYQVVDFDTTRDTAILQAELNAYANLGWELVWIANNKAFLKLNPTTPHV